MSAANAIDRAPPPAAEPDADGWLLAAAGVAAPGAVEAAGAAALGALDAVEPPQAATMSASVASSAAKRRAWRDPPSIRSLPSSRQRVPPAEWLPRLWTSAVTSVSRSMTHLAPH